MKNLYENYENEQNETVDIVPIKKWQRCLVYAADLIINFFLAFVLFSVAITPIFKATTNYNAQEKAYAEKSQLIADILIENGVLIKRPSYDKVIVSAHIDYTFYCFLSYYVMDTDTSLVEDAPDYGHHLSNEVFYHFYHDIRQNDEAYYLSFDNANKKYSYFEKVDTAYVLNETIKNQLKPFFDPKDSSSKSGETIITNLRNQFFKETFGDLNKDIEKNDLHLNNVSYLETEKEIKRIESYHGELLSVSSLISILLSWAICYLAVPLVHKRGKTVAMIMMGIERISVDRLYLSNKKEVLVSSAYAFFSNFFAAWFLPLSLVTFNYLFSMPILTVSAIISLVLMIASFTTILINYLNRSPSDLISRSVLIKNSELDKIYRARGYKI